MAKPNVHTASRDELVEAGIRAELADEILKRRRKGKIDLEALDEVPGVGPATLEQLRKSLDFRDQPRNGDDRGEPNGKDAADKAAEAGKRTVDQAAETGRRTTIRVARSASVPPSRLWTSANARPTRCGGQRTYGRPGGRGRQAHRRAGRRGHARADRPDREPDPAGPAVSSRAPPRRHARCRRQWRGSRPRARPRSAGRC